MATGEIKFLQFSDGTTVTAPTSLVIDIASITSYVDDTAFETAKGSAGAAGDLYFNTTVNLPRFHNGTAWGSVVDESTTQTLTNKQIDADTNVLSNISDTQVKAGAAIDATKIADGSVTSTEFQYINTLSSNVQDQIDAKIPSSEKSAANGVASLDGSGKVPTSELPDSVLGALQYQGTWDADTNSPTLSNGSGTEGHYYIVSVAGTTSIDGISDWEVGDWIVANDTTWEKIDNSDKVSSVAGKTGVVTLDLDDVDNGGSLNSPNIAESVLMDEQASTPSNPAAGKKKLYPKTDGKMYTLDSAGSESELGAGAGGSGSGEINYVVNPSAADNIDGWTESLDGAVDVSRTATAAELPRENLTGTGIKIVGTAGASGEYVAYAFTLDDADVSKKLKIRWDQKPISGYTAGDFEVVVWDGTNELIPAQTEVHAGTGEFLTSFDTNTSLSYELRIKSTVATTVGLVISDVIVGPGSIVTGQIVEDKLVARYSSSSISNRASGNTIVDYATKEYDDGYVNDMVTTGASWKFTAPREGKFAISAAFAFSATAAWGSIEEVRLELFKNGTLHTRGDTITPWSNALSAPATVTLSTELELSATDYIHIEVHNGTGAARSVVADATQNWVTISEVTDSKAGLNVGQNRVEYAYNTSGITTAGASDAASFGYGPAGVAIGAIDSVTGTNSTTDMRVRFQSPVQLTDRVAVEVDTGDGKFVDVATHPNLLGNTLQSGSSYGVRLESVGGSDTDYNVRFGNKGRVNNGAYGASGSTWSGISSYKWRVVKHSAGIPVGFAQATADSAGLVKKNKWQLKRQASNVTATGVLTDLSYTLEAGKTYRITFNMRAIGTGRNIIQFKDGTNIINVIDAGGGTASTGTVVWTMATTALTFNCSFLSSNLEGDATQEDQTHVIVEELSNYVEVSDW